MRIRCQEPDSVESVLATKQATVASPWQGESVLPDVEPCPITQESLMVFYDRIGTIYTSPRECVPDALSETDVSLLLSRQGPWPPRARGSVENLLLESQVLDILTHGGPVIKPLDEPTASMQSTLGNNGIRRIRNFMPIRDGWDSGRGKAFSKASLAVLDYFLQFGPEFSIMAPSVFLTHNGNIQLEWSDLRGNEFEIEFFPEHFECYLGSSDSELHFRLSQVLSLVAVIEQAQGNDVVTA